MADVTTNSAALARYYDALTRYAAMAAHFGLGRAEPTTMHRRLRGSDGSVSGERLHDLLFAELGAPNGRSLFDAGCGVGGTLIAWAARGARGEGVTLSRTQRDRAAELARSRGSEAQCRFHCASYDDDLDRLLGNARFDAVVAIESLAHAPAPDGTIARLARLLRPGGRLAVVDDMPAEALSPDDADLAAFRAHWLAPGVRPAAAVRQAIVSAGLRVVVERDLTDETERRAHTQIDRLARLNRLVRPLLPRSLARIVDSHYGGLMLERLYSRHVMQYRMIVAAASD